MIFLETSLFTRQVARLFTDEEYRQLQAMLSIRPEMGSLIPGGGGLRKVRWGFRKQGKRGGVRVIYYWAVAQDQILMLAMYPKNVQSNLSHAQLKVLRQVIEEEYR
ncbi:MAG: type II toxin-antitoxin system RelE/ParE family toxin [Anaerolineae bacterium]|nr:type II toxin-antitoxin system RelE/ParE family toxin [Anaerolineae bacterium]MCO5192481.1 type II toxin-antitoxin system RelE/ParE family toxin [Anaerolineae bacterium]MCO5203397.1 type II toxin-antitoxin system RelE/ParE family toxin [Anaerolineae bacterium]